MCVNVWKDEDNPWKKETWTIVLVVIKRYESFLCLLAEVRLLNAF